MKKTHIIAIAIIAVLISIFVVASMDATTRANFTEAFNQPNKEFNVSGVLNRDRLVEYNPEVNPNEMSFYLIDDAGVERKVILERPKPQDFEQSEKIVLTGSAKGNAFVATSILMKCPSKYNEQNTVDYEGEQFIQG